MRRFAAALAVLAVFALSAPLRAQESVDDARARQDDLRRQAAEVAAEIDLLEAEDADVAKALADLDGFIAQAEADIEAARQAIASAEADAATADAEAARLGDEMAAVRQLLRTLAVEAYVSSGSDELDYLLASDDPALAELRSFFLGVAQGETDEAIDRLRDLQGAQRDARAQADEARAAAEATRVELEQHLTELDAARVAQLGVRAEIEVRIGEWEGEAVALQAQEDELVAFIQAEEARIAAARQAELQRQAEEAERQAELQRQAEEAERQAELARQQAEQEAQAEEQAEADETTQGDETGEGDQADAPEEEPGDEAPAEEEPPALPPEGGPAGFIWPISGSVVSGFGYRIHPIFGTERFHSGLDINGSTGTPIAASAAGVVIFAGWKDGYGNTIIVDHGGGLSSLYAHQSQLGAGVGASVGQGETIGYVGSTGWSTGPHLHFEIRLSGSPVDPYGYL